MSDWDANIAAQAVKRFGVFEADLRVGELRKNGSKVKLEGQPFQILSLLLESPGELVTREELKQRLWPSDTFVDFEHSINAAVKRLREALGDSADSPRFIETLPRRGYRFIYPMNGVAAVVQRPAAWWHRGWAISLFAFAFLALLIAAALASNFWGLRSLAFKAKLDPIRSIAILPFKNNTGDPAQEPLVDALTDALTTELATAKALRVTSVTSAMTYKGQSKKLPQIAAELSVDAVIEGSVMRSGDRMWFDVQLLHAPSDTHLWANRYERTIQEFPALVASAARDIIVETKAQLSQNEQARLAREQLISPEAYVAYRKAREIWWSKITEEGYWKSIEFYRQAIAKDPSFADAYSGMARSYAFLSQLYPTKEVQAQARTAAAKALELDPSLSEPHALLGYMLIDDDWTAAEKELRLALELNPNDTLAHVHYSWFLNTRGRHTEALAEILRAEQLDPLSPYVSASAIFPFVALQRFEDAVKQGQKALELNPDFWLTYNFLGGAYWHLQRYDEAIRVWEKQLTLPGANPGWPLSRLVVVYMKVGRKDDAAKAMARLESIAKQTHLEPEYLALALAAVGRKDEAIRTLQQAQREGNYHPYMFRNQLNNFLGDDPRFQKLFRDVGAPPSPWPPK